MKTTNSFFRLMLIFTALVFIITGCPKDEEEPLDLEIESLMAGDVDLLNTTDPVLPVDAVIMVQLTANLNPATANTSVISLVQDYDDSSVELKVWVSGPRIKITPAETLASGALYQLTIGPGLISSHDQPLDSWTKSFRTEGSFAPGGALAHWTFEENANDVIGNYDPSTDGVVEITYTDSRNAAAGKAATFDGDVSIIEIPNGDKLIDAENLTISFWFKTNSFNHLDGSGNPAQHYLMGLGIWNGFFFAVSSNYDGLWGYLSYVDAEDSAMWNWTQGVSFGSEYKPDDIIDYAKNLTVSQVQDLYYNHWLHFVYTYNSNDNQAILYHNGEKMVSFDYDYSEDQQVRDIVGIKYTGTEPDMLSELAFGFFKSSGGTCCCDEWFYDWGCYDNPYAMHFKGQMDDVRFWHKTLTPEEISLMYEAEKP